MRRKGEGDQEILREDINIHNCLGYPEHETMDHGLQSGSARTTVAVLEILDSLAVVMP